MQMIEIAYFDRCGLLFTNVPLSETIDLSVKAVSGFFPRPFQMGVRIFFWRPPPQGLFYGGLGHFLKYPCTQGFFVPPSPTFKRLIHDTIFFLIQSPEWLQNVSSEFPQLWLTYNLHLCFKNVTWVPLKSLRELNFCATCKIPGLLR